MASGYKADIEDFHRYRVLLDSISEVGIPCRGDSKCKGPGVGSGWSIVVLLFCSHIPARPYCLSYTIAVWQ